MSGAACQAVTMCGQIQPSTKPRPSSTGSFQKLFHEVAAILEQPSTRLTAFDLAAWWEQSAAEFRQKLPRYYATFLADPAVMRWVRYRGWRLEQESPQGERVRIRVRFDAEEEALQFA